MSSVVADSTQDLVLFRLEGMEILVDLPMHEEVSTREFYDAVRTKSSVIMNIVTNVISPVILQSGKHLRCGCFKRWRKMTIGFLTCYGSTKSISHFEGLSTPTTAEYGLLKIPELSYKLHCTTTKCCCGVDIPNLSL